MENLEDKVEGKSFWSKARNKTAAVLGAALLFAYGAGGCGGSSKSDCELVCERAYDCCYIRTFSMCNRPRATEIPLCIAVCNEKSYLPPINTSINKEAMKCWVETNSCSCEDPW